MVWYVDGRELLVEGLDAHIALVDEKSPLGQGKSGFLKTRGPLAKAGVHIKESFERHGSFDLVIHKGFNGHAMLDNFIADEKCPTFLVLYYLPLQQTPAPGNNVHPVGANITLQIYGIILRCIDDGVNSVFRMVGKFKAYDHRFIQAACCQFSEFECVASSPNWGSRHEITII